MKSPSDVKVINVVSNINRGLDFWETRIDFLDYDTGELLPRVFTYSKEMNPKELADFIEQKRLELVQEIEIRQNAPITNPEVINGDSQ